MKAGMLRQVVFVENPEARREKRRANVRSLRANELLDADQLVEENSFRFHFRWDDFTNGISIGWKLFWNSIEYTPQPAQDPTGKRRELVVIANRVL